MKKLATVGLSLTLFFLAFAPSALAAKPDLAGERREAREEARVQIQAFKKEEDQVKKELREQFKEKRDAILAKLRQMFPGILPAGISKGEVVGVSGDGLMVKYDGQSVTLKITDKTRILSRFGGKIALTEVKVGHIVSARGVWQDPSASAGQVTMEVRVLRDLSLERRPATFWGKIKTLAEDQKSLVLETGKRGDLTVLVDTNTKIVDRSAKKIDFSALAVGHRIRVTGVWDGEKSVAQTRVVKDWSAGPRQTVPTATPGMAQ